MSTLVFMGRTVTSLVYAVVRKIDVTLPMELVSVVHLDGLGHSVIQVSKQSQAVLYINVGVSLHGLISHNHLILSDLVWAKAVKPLNRLNINQRPGKMDQWTSFAINHILFDYNCWHKWYITKISGVES